MNTPFDTIESAQEFLTLLREAVNDANGNAHTDMLAEADSRSTRRLDALRLVLYKLEKLEQHLKASSRLLNDLRTLRRLLLEERHDERDETSDERHARPERSEVAAVAQGVESKFV
jgi:formiminotetrahydrofolate cyclodeaminase